MLFVAVKHQLSLVAACSLASGAEKVKLPYMEFHVSFHVTGDESFTTRTSVVRPLPSVNSHVHGKVGQVREILATLDTSILLAFYMLFSVDVKMLLQKLLYVEAIVTSSAHLLVVDVLHRHILEEWTRSCQNDIVCRNMLVILTHQGHICKVNVLHQKSGDQKPSKSARTLAGIFAL